jgi:hypothetical protein
MLGIDEPHPSRGFYTEREFDFFKSACPYADAENIKKIEVAAAARRRGYRAKMRRLEKEQQEKSNEQH